MIYLCVGRREVGKTTLAMHLVRRVPTRVMIDPRGLTVADYRARTVQDVQEGFDRLHDGSLSTLTITPDTDVRDVCDFCLREIRTWIPRHPDRPLALVLDELRFIDTNTPACDWLLRCSARTQVTIVGTAHRPVDISPDVRAIADLWLIFRTTQEHDLRILAEKCGAKISQLAGQLREREFIAWDDTRGDFTIHRDAASWYVPLVGSNVLSERTIIDLPPVSDRPRNLFGDE